MPSGGKGMPRRRVHRGRTTPRATRGDVRTVVGPRRRTRPGAPRHHYTGTRTTGCVPLDVGDSVPGGGHADYPRQGPFTRPAEHQQASPNPGQEGDRPPATVAGGLSDGPSEASLTASLTPRGGPASRIHGMFPRQERRGNAPDGSTGPRDGDRPTGRPVSLSASRGSRPAARGNGGDEFRRYRYWTARYTSRPTCKAPATANAHTASCASPWTRGGRRSRCPAVRCPAGRRGRVGGGSGTQ